MLNTIGSNFFKFLLVEETSDVIKKKTTEISKVKKGLLIFRFAKNDSNIYFPLSRSGYIDHVLPHKHCFTLKCPPFLVQSNETTKFLELFKKKKMHSSHAMFSQQLKRMIDA